MRSLTRRTVAEAIGTFVLVLIGTGAVMVDAGTEGTLGPAGVALAFGAVVTAMVFALGPVSGAHLNPAVTVALWSAGRFPRGEVPSYLGAQCAGAIAASFALRALLGNVGGVGATVPVLDVPGAFALELLISFVLMFVIVAVTADRRVAPGFAAIPVGLAVGMGVLVGGPLTGGSMNPARSLGPALAGGVWTAHWLYWAAPVVGMLAAVRAYELLRPAGTFPDDAEPRSVADAARAGDEAEPTEGWSVRDGLIVPLEGLRHPAREGGRDATA